jgi:hypothetical protein
LISRPCCAEQGPIAAAGHSAGWWAQLAPNLGNKGGGRSKMAKNQFVYSPFPELFLAMGRRHLTRC